MAVVTPKFLLLHFYMLKSDFDLFAEGTHQKQKVQHL